MAITAHYEATLSITKVIKDDGVPVVPNRYKNDDVLTSVHTEELTTFTTSRPSLASVRALVTGHLALLDESAD